jgi:predicted nuclease with TOPRIM domain
MNTQELANEITLLKDTISGLISEIGYLRDDLKKNRDESESLRFRLSELENAISNE